MSVEEVAEVLGTSASLVADYGNGYARVYAPLPEDIEEAIDEAIEAVEEE